MTSDQSRPPSLCPVQFHLLSTIWNIQEYFWPAKINQGYRFLHGLLLSICTFFRKTWMLSYRNKDLTKGKTRAAWPRNDWRIEVVLCFLSELVVLSRWLAVFILRKKWTWSEHACAPFSGIWFEMKAILCVFTVWKRGQAGWSGGVYNEANTTSSSMALQRQ